MLLLIATLSGVGYWLAHRERRNELTIATPIASRSAPSQKLASVLQMSWSADGGTFLTRSSGDVNGASSVLLHRVASFERAQPIVMNESLVWKAVLTPDASAVIVVGESLRVRRIDLQSRASELIVDLAAPSQRPSAGVSSAMPVLAVSIDGSRLAIAVDREVRLIDLDSGKESTRLSGHDADVLCMDFSEDGQFVAMGDGDGSVRVSSCATGETIRCLADHQGPVSVVRMLKGNQRLASVGGVGDGSLRCWDLTSGALIWQVTADRIGLHALSASPDGEFAATGGADRRIDLWSLNERRLVRSFDGHEGTIGSLHFSPDGKTLFSAASDGTIRKWDVESAELLDATDVKSIDCTSIPFDR